MDQVFICYLKTKVEYQQEQEKRNKQHEAYWAVENRRKKELEEKEKIGERIREMETQRNQALVRLRELERNSQI